MRVTVLGNFSGRNAGDNAILGNLLDDMASAYPEIEFLVPTFDAAYVRRAFGRHRVRALGLMPWNGAIKILGLPTFRAMLSCDCVLVTDNILFDRRYFNPLFNYLSTIALAAPLCRRRGIPIVLYNASVGPIRTPRGARALQRVLDAGPLAILRDEGSRRHLEELGLRLPEIHMGADCALNTATPSPERVDAILARLSLAGTGRPLLAFNVNTYIDTWHKQGGQLGRETFVRLVAAVADRLVDELDVDVAWIVTQVMDRHIAREVIAAMRRRERVAVADNPSLTYQELTGVLSRAGLLVGMRTHSLILACAAGTPIVNLNAYPKSKAFAATVGLDRWTVEFDELSEERLFDMAARAWSEREATRAALRPAVAREQAKAVASVQLVGRLLGLEEQAAPVLEPAAR